MSDWEQYVEQTMVALVHERFGPRIPMEQHDPVMLDYFRGAARAALAAVGPLIVEDTQQRLVEAAARAVVRAAPPAVGTTNPFESLERTLAFSSQDWSAARDFAWLYGIVLGWDGDDPDESTMTTLAAKHEWSDQQVARLRALHQDFKAASAAYRCQAPEGAA